MIWELTFERQSLNKLNEDTTKKKIRQLVSLINHNPSSGFRGRLRKLHEPEEIPQSGGGKTYKYEAKICVENRTAADVHAAIEEFKKIREAVEKKAKTEKWELTASWEGATPRPILPVDGEEYSSNRKKSKFVVPQLSDDVIRKNFPGVYERNAQIRIIHSAIETSIETNGEILSHLLLYGQPGACKTKLMEKFKAWYEIGCAVGEERVSFVDGTTMTKAGLENWLIELAEENMLPEVLVVDEIEKQPMDNLLCLNAVMGSGILAKLNARRKNDRYRAPFVVCGICNDQEALQQFRSGALWSRFTHKLYCPRPSKELSLKILKEMTAIIPGGKTEWAVEAMKFGWDELGQRDIREIKGHLDGRHRLMNGSWQNDKRAIIQAEQREAKQIASERQK